MRMAHTYTAVIGKGHRIRIPEAVLAALNLQDGDTIGFLVENGMLMCVGAVEVRMRPLPRRPSR